MEQSTAGGCLVWLISLLLGFALGVNFLLQNNAPDSADILPTMVPNHECSGTLVIASPSGVTDPADAFAFGVHIDYQGKTLENAWVSIDSSYTRNTFVINGQQYANVSKNNTVTLTSDDRLDFYYEGSLVEPVDTLILNTATTTVICSVTSNYP